MQNLVNKIYAGDTKDRYRPLTRFEFEQRDVRNKLDLADIYIQLEQIKQLLADNNMTIEPFSEQEAAIIEMVQEDRKTFAFEMETLEYERKMASYKKGSVKERIRRLLYGTPTSPKQADVTVRMEPTPEQKEVMDTILKTVSKTPAATVPADDPLPTEMIFES